MSPKWLKTATRGSRNAAVLKMKIGFVEKKEEKCQIKFGKFSFLTILESGIFILL